MPRFVFLFVLLLLVLPAEAQDAARVHLARALDAMGGEPALRSLESVRLTGFGHEFILQALMRQDGPQHVQYERFTELRDLANGRSRRLETEWLAAEPDGRTFGFVLDGEVLAFQFRGRMLPGQASQRNEARDRLRLSPERILLTAQAAPDLHTKPDTTLFGQPFHRIAFRDGGRRITVFLNQHTYLPGVVEVFGAMPDDFSWRMWGDVTTQVRYYYWAMEPGGLRYPRQWDLRRNGKPYQSYMLTDFAVNPLAPADSFAIAPEVTAQFQAMNAQPRPALRPGVGPDTLWPGVYQLPSTFRTVVVQQSDGLVLIEAPVDAMTTEAVLDEVARLFPTEQVKAAVIAAEASTQFGGVRALVARGIPVYAAAINQAILQEMIAAPHTQQPDALARNPRPLEFRAVTGPTPLGTGANRLVLYPAQGALSERGLLAHFPERQGLYAGSMLTPQRFAATHWLERAAEVRTVVMRHGLPVETLFTLYAPPQPWTRFEAAWKSAWAGE